MYDMVSLMSYPFDKYDYYRKAVQAPEYDARLFRRLYKQLTGKKLITLGEDFCGTFAISCEWVKLDQGHKSIGVDISREPIAYGQKHYLSQLSPDQQKRVRIINANVLDQKLPKADCIAAFNFSYFIFKTRDELRTYFKNVYRRLPKNGVFFCDCFGGPESFQCVEDETKVGGKFTVYWDQAWFDPINHLSQFYLHFKPKGKKKYKRVFSYYWRMWSLPEIREIMQEAGFKKTYVYWEGTDKRGRGNGRFTRTERTREINDSWIALVAGHKL